MKKVIMTRLDSNKAEYKEKILHFINHCKNKSMVESRDFFSSRSAELANRSEDRCRNFLLGFFI